MHNPVQLITHVALHSLHAAGYMIGRCTQNELWAAVVLRDPLWHLALTFCCLLLLLLLCPTEEKRSRRVSRILAFAVPTLCDATGSTLMNVGLIYT
jgi:hypothetical protein